MGPGMMVRPQGMPQHSQQHPHHPQQRFSPSAGIAHVMLPSPGPPVATPSPPPPIRVIEIERPLSNEELVDNNRGNVILLAPPPQAALFDEFGQKFKKSSVVSARTGNCKRGELLGITLGLTLDGQDDSQALLSASNLHPMVRATIGWGLGSASYQATVDWKNGTQISVEAEYVQYVDATYVLSTLPWTPDLETVAPTYRLSAGFAYGGVGRATNPATYTELVQIETPDDTRIVQIPKFAQSMTVLPIFTADAVLIDVFGFGSLYDVQWATTVPLSNTQQNQPTRIPLQNGARFVQVTNNQMTTGPAICFLIFELSL